MSELPLSYQAIKTQNQSREADELRSEHRKKSLLYLVLHYLAEEGYAETTQTLMKETSLDLTRYTLCDNCDLDTILTDYESYYYVKFQKYPKIVKKGTPGQMDERLQLAMATGAHKQSPAKTRAAQLPRINSQPDQTPKASYVTPAHDNATNGATQKQAPTKVQTSSAPVNSNREGYNSVLSKLQVTSVSVGKAANESNSNGSGVQANGKIARQDKKIYPHQIIDVRRMLDNETKLVVNGEENGGLQKQEEAGSDKLMKPLGNFLAMYSSEWRELALVISRDILLTNPSVRWDDIVGLDIAKRLIKEAVVYPIKYPQLFSGILSPWKGLLLYGPPGTGKTLLAKAVATECKTTFFNISASTIVSKWRGDSEKLVRVLFEMARFYAPSTIFVDELDSLMSQRSGSGGESTEHEGSRRMKTELLIQMDGLAKSDDLVFLLAASNLPWELDNAMLRRLEKRILVDLPNCEARAKMFQTFLPPDSDTEQPATQPSGGVTASLICDIDYNKCAERSDGYSGSDIKLVCKEAAMRVVRKVFDILENNPERGNLEQRIRLDKLTTADVLAALEATKPSARQFAPRYLAWQKEFESA